ncbi:hypothetical protein [Pseudosulfitobacter sp. SM2401]|uniref:hypothetical protein n=1 Tax=Pseudosulfitobacter sp. SM2401 TaxID=3350098 RepID=UPI0036F374CB
MSNVEILGAPPTKDSMSKLAVAFQKVASSNLALLKQAAIPKIDVAGLEDVNASLTAAQANATSWDNTISANVQNSLELIQNYNSDYQAIMQELNKNIETLRTSTASNPPPKPLINETSALLGGLQTSLQQYLYGSGGTKSKPVSPSILSVMDSINAYRTDVIEDHKKFATYTTLVTSQSGPLATAIGGYHTKIESAIREQGYDSSRALDGLDIAGLGILMGVVAVVLAPETGGTSMVLAGVGLAAAGAAGGAVMTGENLSDYNIQAGIISSETTQLNAALAEQALIPTILTSCKGVSDDTNNIFSNIGTIATTWQQVDNLLGDMISALALPEKDIANWFKQHPQYPDKGGSGYSLLGLFLHIHLSAPAKDWDDLSKLAQKVLNALANAKKVTIPAGTVATQEVIVAAMHAA